MNYNLIELLRYRLLEDLKEYIPANYFHLGLNKISSKSEEAAISATGHDYAHSTEIRDLRWAHLAIDLASNIIDKSKHKSPRKAAAANALYSLAALEQLQIMGRTWMRIISADDQWDENIKPMFEIEQDHEAIPSWMDIFLRHLRTYLALLSDDAPGEAKTYDPLLSVLEGEVSLFHSEPGPVTTQVDNADPWLPGQKQLYQEKIIKKALIQVFTDKGIKPEYIDDKDTGLDGYSFLVREKLRTFSAEALRAFVSKETGELSANIFNKAWRVVREENNNQLKN